RAGEWCAQVHLQRDRVIRKSRHGGRTVDLEAVEAALTVERIEGKLRLCLELRVETRLLPGHYTTGDDARDTDLRHCGIRPDGVRFPDHPRVAGGERRRILDLEAKERIRVAMRPLLEHAAQLHPAAIALVVVAV